MRLDTIVGSRLQYRALQQVVAMEHEREAQVHRQQELGAALAEIAQQRAQVRAELRRSRLADLAKAEHERSEAAAEHTKAQKRTTLQTLTAPVQGMV